MVSAVIDTLIGADFRRLRSLVRVLGSRAIRVRYRGSTLGIFWSVLNPVLMTFVYTFVFGRAFATFYHGSKLQYMAALFSGLAIMNFFSSATFQALQSVVSHGLLLNKMRVPSIVFPVSTVVANSVQLVFGTLPLLILMTLVIGRNPLWAPLLVPLLFALVCLALGVGLVLSSFYVYFRDIPNFYELIYFAIFVATPVFYPLAIIGTQYRPFVEYAPLSLIVEQVRAIAVTGEAPSLVKVALAVTYGLVALVAGIVVFRRASKAFMDYL